MKCYFGIAASYVYASSSFRVQISNPVPAPPETSDRELVQGARDLSTRDWLWLRGCVGNLFAFLLNNSMFDKQSDYNLRQHNILQETSTDLTRTEKGRRSLASEKFWLSCDFSHAVCLFALHLHQTTLVKLMKWSLSGLVQMTLAVTLPEHFISMKILFSANGV